MEIECLKDSFSVCKIADLTVINRGISIFFFAKTDEELSLVCRTKDIPEDTMEREDGWLGFRIRGILDFSQIGILSRISGILSENGISVFMISTYNTDYFLVKEENSETAVNALTKAGYVFSN